MQAICSSARFDGLIRGQNGMNKKFDVMKRFVHSFVIVAVVFVPQSGDFPGSRILDIATEEGGGGGHVFKLVKYGKTIIPPPDVNKNNIPDVLEDIPTPLDEEESPSSGKKGIPGFDVVSAIAGLLVVAYLLRGKD